MWVAREAGGRRRATKGRRGDPEEHRINTLVLAEADEGVASSRRGATRLRPTRRQRRRPLREHTPHRTPISPSGKPSNDVENRPAGKMRLSVNMHCALLLSILVAAHATIYIPPLIREEHLLTDTMLNELINQMGNELAEAADSYLEYQDKPKEIPIELPADYDGIDTLNPNPSIRDQEYLQHSTLWSHQRISNNDKVADRHKIQAGSLKSIKDEKTENTLPAYCTPPNPCPVGYTSENNCIVNFDNTAAFSRDYQSAQDCMCDTEHMLDCSVDSTNSNGLSGIHLTNSDFDSIVEQFQHENPFFQGDKLPIAAKKGINVIY